MTSTLGTPNFGVSDINMSTTIDYARTNDIETINISDISLADPSFIFEDTVWTEDKTKYNYREDQILSELTAYIQKTYGAHYASKDIQTIDVWQSLGIEKESCQSNVLKYAMRYGKKGGHNKDDLLKILHYTILWWHFTQPKE